MTDVDFAPVRRLVERLADLQELQLAGRLATSLRWPAHERQLEDFAKRYAEEDDRAFADDFVAWVRCHDWPLDDAREIRDLIERALSPYRAVGLQFEKLIGLLRDKVTQQGQLQAARDAESRVWRAATECGIPATKLADAMNGPDARQVVGVDVTPEDLERQGYVQVGVLWPENRRFNDYGQVRRYLDALPDEPAPVGIRNRSIGRRRYVHEADWCQHFREKDRAISEMLDDPTAQRLIGTAQNKKRSPGRQ